MNPYGAIASSGYGSYSPINAYLGGVRGYGPYGLGNSYGNAFGGSSGYPGIGLGGSYGGNAYSGIAQGAFGGGIGGASYGNIGLGGIGGASYGNIGLGGSYGAVGAYRPSTTSPIFGAGYPIGTSSQGSNGYSYAYSTPFSQVSVYSNSLGGYGY